MAPVSAIEHTHTQPHLVKRNAIRAQRQRFGAREAAQNDGARHGERRMARRPLGKRRRVKRADLVRAPVPALHRRGRAVGAGVPVRERVRHELHGNVNPPGRTEWYTTLLCQHATPASYVPTDVSSSSFTAVSRS